MQNRQYVLRIPKFLKYTVATTLSFLLAVAGCVIRFAITYNYTYNHEYYSKVEVFWFHWALVLILCAVFSSYVISKTERGKRSASCLTTLCAFIVGVSMFVYDSLNRIHIVDSGSNLYSTFGRFEYRTLGDPRTFFTAACGLLFAVTVVMAALDDRKESKARLAAIADGEDANVEGETFAYGKRPEKEAPVAGFDAVDRLFQLKQLLDAGILSEKEYEEKKTQYVNKL